MSGIRSFGRHLAFSGRATRRTFWMLAGPSLVMLVVFGIIIPPIAIVLALAAAWPMASAAVRRLHDVGLSGKWLLPLVITPVLMLLVLVAGNSLLTLILLATINPPIGADTIEHAAVAAEEMLGWTLAAWTPLSAIALAWRGTSGPNRFAGDPRARL